MALRIEPKWYPRIGDSIDVADLARQGVRADVATRDGVLCPQLSRAWGPSLSDHGARLTVCVEAAPDSAMARKLESGSPGRPCSRG